jgi:hypothetical protein
MTLNKRKFMMRDVSKRYHLMAKSWHTTVAESYGSDWAEPDDNGPDGQGLLHYWWESLWFHNKKRVQVKGEFVFFKPLPEGFYVANPDALEF